MLRDAHGPFVRGSVRHGRGGGPYNFRGPSIRLPSSSMQLSASIFKAYDVRGVVPSTLNEEVARALGRAFGETALKEGEKAVAVGRDGRLSGPSLSAALVQGL